MNTSRIVSLVALLIAVIVPCVVWSADGGMNPDGGVPIDCDESLGECDTPDTSKGPSSGDDYQSMDDDDDDGILDSDDLCPRVMDPNQSDLDSDGIGDRCDNCPSHANEDQRDTDGDRIGDVCDNDADGDYVLLYPSSTSDTEMDSGVGPDVDGGAGPDGGTDLDGGQGAGDEGNGNRRPSDNCPLVFNPNQEDLDDDGRGDGCDDDIDGDGLPNLEDPCPFGDVALEEKACAGDSDGAGVSNSGVSVISDFEVSDGQTVKLDNCPTIINPDQVDMDGDGDGDLCDHDVDNDNITDSQDNCFGCAPTLADAGCTDLTVFNPGQEDLDRDGVGDACDDRFCFVVPALIDEVDGEEEQCLDPLGEFRVDTPNMLNVRTGDEVRLRLFANRQNAALQYYWRIRSWPGAEAAEIQNHFGATGYSTPFEYHYTEEHEPTFVPNKVGYYEIEVQVIQVFEDDVTGEIGLEASERAIFKVSGASIGTGGECDCVTVGRGNSNHSGLIWLLIIGLGAIYFRRRC